MIAISNRTHRVFNVVGVYLDAFGHRLVGSESPQEVRVFLSLCLSLRSHKLSLIGPLCFLLWAYQESFFI